MTDDRSPAEGSDPPADARETTDSGTADAADAADAEGGGCCGLEAAGIGLIGFGVLISIGIPVVIFVGWIPVAIGALMLWYAKRRGAQDTGDG